MANLLQNSALGFGGGYSQLRSSLLATAVQVDKNKILLTFLLIEY
jgi:hypothetical protein